MSVTVGSTVSLTELDAGTDSPKAARSQIKTIGDRINEIAGKTLLESPDKTGADAGVVSGTAGTSGNLVEWNADGDAVDSGVAGADVVEYGGTINNPTLSLDTNRTPSASRPTLVTVTATANVDSGSFGSAKLSITGASDLDVVFNQPTASTGDNFIISGSASGIVPANTTYQVKSNGSGTFTITLNEVVEWPL